MEFLFANDTLFLNGNPVVLFTQEPNAIPIPSLETVDDEDDKNLIQNSWTCYSQLQGLLRKTALKEKGSRFFAELYGEKNEGVWSLELVLFADFLHPSTVSIRGQDPFQIYNNAVLLFKKFLFKPPRVSLELLRPFSTVRILSAIALLVEKYTVK